MARVHAYVWGHHGAHPPIVAQLRGGGKVEESGGKVRQGLWIALVCGIAMTGIMFLSRPFYNWLDVDPAMIGIAVGYLNASAAGLIPAMLYVSLRYTEEGLRLLLDCS